MRRVIGAFLLGLVVGAAGIMAAAWYMASELERQPAYGCEVREP